MERVLPACGDTAGQDGGQTICVAQLRRSYSKYNTDYAECNENSHLIDPVTIFR